jgi:hypothetical protein
MNVKKRQSASKRVAWPEPGHQDGGEFRLTWGRLAGIITLLIAMFAAVPTFWALSDHWMNRGEIEKAMKTHAEHDAGVQTWNSYGFAANRVEYLDDKQAECDAKKMTQAKLIPADAAMCARYETKLKAKTLEAAELKSKAVESTKEK